MIFPVVTCPILLLLAYVIYISSKSHNKDILRHTAHKTVSCFITPKFANDSYFRFDDDNDMKKKYSHNYQNISDKVKTDCPIYCTKNDCLNG